ncbi:ribosome-associated translation inhibitor RaiA [Chryseoglobus sp. 28M-23]|uniref:ribosome hibernation-promoting factor, HPF/YfiA family n=1 Tax=Chryseoglobus sp. 28M-23 TaxID=2772253 RepID=UPI001747D269|nr:ribosome-associated translation inhibitor RaiA [Chryseoglobus sp. 28M-23]QOD93193.1 ribosome-associated translation inhibitor RaiA [Chryseoglobus sp. 28M-23]
MDITITGRNMGITDRFRDYATEKAEKVEHLADRAQILEIKVSRHHEKLGRTGHSGDDRVEMTVIGPGPVVRAEASGSDKYVAFDIVIDKLLERLRRAKDKKKVHRGKHRPVSLREATADGFSVVDITPADPETIEKVATGAISTVSDEPAEGDEEYSPVVIRTKVFPSTMMTVDEAVDHMELVGHDFFLFIDAETDRPSVVYRRTGWNYGVIGLETEPAAETPARARRRG